MTSVGRVCIVIVLVIILVKTNAYIAMRHEPSYDWSNPEDSRSDGLSVQARFYLWPSELDLESEILRPSQFMFVFPADVYAGKNGSFKVWLFWNPDHPEEDFAYPQGSYRKVAVFRQNYRGVGPLTSRLETDWILAMYPWDTYSLRIIFSLNGTTRLQSINSSLELSPSFENKWKVKQDLTRLD